MHTRYLVIVKGHRRCMFFWQYNGRTEHGTFRPWNFPFHVLTLYLCLRITSASTLVGCGLFKPVAAATAQTRPSNSVPMAGLGVFQVGGRPIVLRQLLLW